MLIVTDIALNRLVPSPHNVRRTGQVRIEELAASISAHGLLQNLTVIEGENTKGKKVYEVIAGGRRLKALKLLAKRKQMANTAPVPCAVVSDANVTELSLAENAQQEPMHPADQFDAFHALHGEYGMSAEDIAARFGVTPAVVKQRLKLATISPKLIKAYRQDEMNLDQLTAFTVTDDHGKQEKVWAALGEGYSREELLDALLDDQVSASDPAARLVGKDAYRAAGGIIVCDLFDEEGEGYFADVDLLCDLADAKLQEAAEAVRAEGWKWVELMRRFDYTATAQLRRIYPRPLPLSEADQARFHTLEGEYDRLLDQEDSEAQSAELERLEQELDALRGEDVFAPADLARAGAFVAIGHDGSVRIERGYVRQEDDPGSPCKAREKKEGPQPLSARLVGELTAQQTVSLRDTLGGNGAVALVAVTHALAAALFFSYERASCLDIRADSRSLAGMLPCIAESPAGLRIEARHAEWAKRLPEEAANLWGFVAGLDEAGRLALLAHCVGLSVDATRQQEDAARPGVAGLASSLGFDMRADWQPTAANYFGRISRTRILDAVREGVSPEAADNLAKLKKDALAVEAERRLDGKGWLPSILRREAA